MGAAWLDRVARQLAAGATTRRGLARLGIGGALAGRAWWQGEAAAACRAPQKACGKGKQCCSGRCKNGKCGKCAGGLAYCPGGCVDRQTSADHCGTCGNACIAGQRCQNGTCTCDGTTCDGCCQGDRCEAGNDDLSCGAGGGACAACGACERCVDGACRPLNLTPNGSACAQHGECCSGNCFGGVCADPVTACGDETCFPPAHGCAGSQCCFGDALFGCSAGPFGSCCGPPATFCCGYRCCAPPDTFCCDNVCCAAPNTRCCFGGSGPHCC